MCIFVTVKKKKVCPKCASPATHQILLLLQIRADMTLKTWPSVTAAEAQKNILTKLFLLTWPVRFLNGNYNLNHCFLIALALIKT